MDGSAGAVAAATWRSCRDWAPRRSQYPSVQRFGVAGGRDDGAAVLGQLQGGFSADA
jgi:hypothetical protein